MSELPLVNRPLHTKIDVSAAVGRLQKHVNNKDFYTRPAYAIIQGGYITHNLNRSNQKRSWYKNTTFKNAILDGVGFSDSVFYLTNFINIKMDNTNLKSCVFQECSFQTDKPVFYTGFGNSVLTACTIRDTIFESAGFAECIFDSTYITNCSFHNTAFEGAIFKDSLFRNVEFRDLNLEFVEFRNVAFDSVALPFNTIPFIFNGMQYLYKTKDNVFIKSAGSNKGHIGIQEYLKLVPDLLVYFEANKNYFPLSNILIANGEYDYAWECITQGVIGAIQIGSFRMLRFFCRLLQVTDYYTSRQKHQMYQFICEQVNKNTRATSLAPNYRFNITELKQILFESNDGLMMSFRIQTNISGSDALSIQLFYSLVHTIIHAMNLSSGYSIQFLYNSAAEIFLQFTQLDPAVLAALIAAFTSIFTLGANTCISLMQYRVTVKELRLKIEEGQAKRLPNDMNLEKHQREMHLLELESQRKQMEIQQLKQANEKTRIENDTLFLTLLAQLEQQYPNIEHLGKQLQEKGIRINSYSHHTANLDNSLLSDALLEIVYSSSVPGQ